jgi:formamidopyrimidine-DNA glycosylase
MNCRDLQKGAILVPELPEVETTRRGIAEQIRGCRIEEVVVRNSRLRQQVPGDLDERLRGSTFQETKRRAKYLLLETTAGELLIHLGMSGSLRIVAEEEQQRTHDHVIWFLEGGRQLRYHDPRRFGLVTWAGDDPSQHPLLRDLGPEPLEQEQLGEILFDRSRGRNLRLRDFLLDPKVVAGVGNIYANEAAWQAGIRPDRRCGRISLQRYQRLGESIQDVLSRAVIQGGTTLNDYVQPDGEPGYFQHHFEVYGRAGEACSRCEGLIRRVVKGQRSLFFCSGCQK